MVAVSECFSSIKGIAMRATRLDTCGNPLSGATGSAVSCGFTKLDFKATIEDGTEFLVKSAGGVLLINQKDAPSLKRLELAGEFAEVDPELYELTGLGSRLIKDGTGNSIGYAVDDQPRIGNFALEVWTEVGGAGCIGGYEWVYTLLPWMVNPIIGDLTVENAPLNFKMAANTRSGTPWGLGPYAAQRAGDGVPIQVQEHFAQYLTKTAPPACSCGYIAL